MKQDENNRPKWKVYSLKRPYRNNKYGHTHDRWAVDKLENGQYVTEFDKDYSKEEAKEAARQAASAGDKIKIEDMDGNQLRIEEKRDSFECQECGESFDNHVDAAKHSRKGENHRVEGTLEIRQ